MSEALVFEWNGLRLTADKAQTWTVERAMHKRVELSTVHGSMSAPASTCRLSVNNLLSFSVTDLPTFVSSHLVPSYL